MNTSIEQVRAEARKATIRDMFADFDVASLVDIASEAAGQYTPSFRNGAEASIRFEIAFSKNDHDALAQIDHKVPKSREANRKYDQGLVMGRFAAKAYMLGFDSLARETR